MNIITITRLFSNVRNTIGIISVDGEPICWSLEPPWKMNKKNESCIIPGIYFYKHYESPMFKRQCIQLLNVYNRDYISIHPGNTHEDTKACILPGLSIGVLGNIQAVRSSSLAMNKIINQSNNIGKVYIVEKF